MKILWICEVCYTKNLERAYQDESFAWQEKLWIDENDSAEKIVQRYNNTLRPKELSRTLLGAVKTKRRKIAHNWQKMNNVTISKNGAMYDVYQCSKCNATGKRFGLSDSITRDKKYKTSKYQNCVKV